MPTLTFQGKKYECFTSETVLDVLLRNGEDVPFSCQEGFCHSCVVRAMKGIPSPESQEDMTPEEMKKNDFLACRCKVESDMEVDIPGEEANPNYRARVIEKKPLSNSIICIRLSMEANFAYRPGQYLNILRDDGLIRSYSIASVQGSNEPLEVHIQKIPGGRMSTWLYTKVSEGDTLTVHGPYGNCFYEEGRSNQDMIMIATGSGLAPIWGILRDAIRLKHSGNIQIFHGSRSAEGLYLVEEMRTIARTNPNVKYYPCISGPDVPAGYEKGRADDAAIRLNPSMKNMRIFLCGNPDMVDAMRKKAIASGADKKYVLVDPFVYSA